MAQVILFGGGDAGGLLIGPNGVRPIPPFDPALLRQIRAVSELTGAGRSLGRDERRREFQELTNKLSNLVVEQVEGVVGPLEPENGLIYQDDDGGFTCGSTGRPPLPIPWPAPRSPSPIELVTSGLLENDVLEVARAVGRSDVELKQLLENPEDVAKELGVNLSERSIRDLQQLAPSRIGELADPVDREVVEFFHKVVEDGKHLDSWATRPYETANDLGVKLSPEAFDRIVAGGSGFSFDPGSVMNPVAIAVVVGVVIMLVPTEAGVTNLSVFDRSGLAKF